MRGAEESISRQVETAKNRPNTLHAIKIGDKQVAAENVWPWQNNLLKFYLGDYSVEKAATLGKELIETVSGDLKDDHR